MTGEFSFYQPPKDNYFQEQTTQLLESAKEYLDTSTISRDRLECNPKTLSNVAERVHKRFKYLEYFHNGMIPSEYKVIALNMYWIAKLHPFWIQPLPGDDDDQVSIIAQINERIAVYLFMRIVGELNFSLYKKAPNLLMDYADELLYSLRYRDISKESLYLMLDSFYYEHYSNKSIADDGSPII